MARKSNSDLVFKSNPSLSASEPSDTLALPNSTDKHPTQMLSQSKCQTAICSLFCGSRFSPAQSNPAPRPEASHQAKSVIIIFPEKKMNAHPPFSLSLSTEPGITGNWLAGWLAGYVRISNGFSRGDAGLQLACWMLRVLFGCRRDAFECVGMQHFW